MILASGVAVNRRLWWAPALLLSIASGGALSCGWPWVSPLTPAQRKRTIAAVDSEIARVEAPFYGFGPRFR